MNASCKANILLVDDRADQLLVMKVALESLQENIVTALSGREALRQLEAQQFAVILLDIRMPDMDGFETATLMRRRQASKDTPLIFVTAYGQSDFDLPRCYALGAVDYIQTPIVPEILRTKVGVFVELYKKTRQVEHQADELRQRLQELSNSNRELEAFSYSLSHDLRAPLRAIHNFTSIILEDHGERLGADANQLLERSLNAAKRMERLLHGLLALGRVSRREMRLSLIDVESLLREIISDRPEWQPPNAQIEIETSLLSMRGDEASLTQCLTNLLSNAVKFVAPGIVPKVRIYSQALGDQARLWIEDNGIGIPSEAHRKIFETFQRMPHAGDYEGEGIGLTIVHRAVERMGGRVGLESEPGKGSRFWIELPALQDRMTRSA